MRIYNSGRISGLGCETYLANFDKADKEIKAAGHTPVNPIFNGLYESAPWWLHMTVDLLMLLTCRAIYLQTNWKKSKGAKIEYWVAKLLFKRIIHQEASVLSSFMPMVELSNINQVIASTRIKNALKQTRMKTPKNILKTKVIKFPDNSYFDVKDILIGIVIIMIVTFSAVESAKRIKADRVIYNVDYSII